jgi:hypothetical protein
MRKGAWDTDTDLCLWIGMGEASLDALLGIHNIIFVMQGRLPIWHK